MPYHILNLQLFADEGGGEATVSGEVVAPTTENPGAEGVATESTGEQIVTADETAEESFDSLIKGKYKQDYDNAVKKAIQNRFKNQKDLQGQIDSIDPIVRMIAEKYNIQPETDGRIPINALQNAIMNDNSMYEKEAFDRGMSVDELRNIKRLEQENHSLRLQNARTEEQREWEALNAEAEEVKQRYPAFDLESEMQNENFGRLLATMQKSGFPNAILTAYEAVHREEIMGGAMKYAVEQTERKISNAIQSGMNRPQENGTSHQATAAVGTVDPSKLTKSQIDDFKRRAERGEKITF